MTVREAGIRDSALLGHIMSVSFRTAFRDLVSAQTMETCAGEENCTALVERILREGQVRFLVGENAGMLAWQDHGETAEIVAIHSLPESWGTGLGKAMLEKALAQIGSKPVFLWAFKENKRARRFYEKEGFRWDGAQRVSEFDGALEVRYGKDGKKRPAGD